MKINNLVKPFVFFLVLWGVIFLTTLRTSTITDPSDIIDGFVDAGGSFSETQIDKDLLKYRTLIITTDINAVAVQKTVKSLLLLNSIDSEAPIDLYIRTEGGWVSDAFAIINVMESISAPVNTHVIGGAFSSGAMILAAGTGVRFGYPYSSVMFHAGKYDDDDQYSEDKLDNERLIKFWKSNANIPVEWLTAEKEDWLHLTVNEALEWGIIDQIKTNSNPCIHSIE